MIIPWSCTHYSQIIPGIIEGRQLKDALSMPKGMIWRFQISSLLATLLNS